MKTWQSSSMPRYRHTKLSGITQDQRAAFQQIIHLLKPYSKLLDQRVNSDQQHELWTRHGFRSHSFHPKHRKGLLFAGLVILKRNVGLYLFALHIDEKFMVKIGGEILPLWKGGSTFHLDGPLSDLREKQFGDLFAEAWSFYKENRWVS